MPRGIPFKSEKERKEARRIYLRDWQRKNKDKRRAYLAKPETKIKRRETDRLYKQKRRKDKTFKDREKNLKKNWYDKNQYKLTAERRERYKTDEEFRKKNQLQNQKWWAQNKEKWNAKIRDKYKTDEEFRRKYQLQNRKWRLANEDHMAKYREKNKSKRNKYERDKTKNDPIFRMQQNLRKRVHYAITHQETTKDETTMNLVGCNLDNLVDFLESNFHEEMSWDNYGEWHVDHIRPCASFDLSEDGQQKVCFNWRNLFPLWGKNNQIKGDRYDLLDELDWILHMQDLGYEGELFLLHQTQLKD